jgi:hypothetical protein
MLGHAANVSPQAFEVERGGEGRGIGEMKERKMQKDHCLEAVKNENKPHDNFTSKLSNYNKGSMKFPLCLIN